MKELTKEEVLRDHENHNVDPTMRIAPGEPSRQREQQVQRSCGWTVFGENESLERQPVGLEIAGRRKDGMP